MFRKAFISLIAGANCATLLLLWLSCYSTIVPPSAFPKIALMGLIFPVVFVINCGFILIWILVEWRAMWLPIVGILPVLSYTLDYHPINNHPFSNTERISTGDSATSLRIASFNTAYFANRDSTEGEWNMSLLIDKLDADIICFQETFIRDWLTNHTLTNKGYKGHGQNKICIYTRHNFVEEEPLLYHEDSTTEFIAYHVCSEKDTLLVINVHLASSCITPDTKAVFSSAVQHHNTQEARENGRIVLSHLAKAMALHQGEIDSIVGFMQQHEGEKILLCGDFNDTPISYTYQHVSKVLTDSYRESGDGLGWTFNTPGFWGRIDHIFHSSNLSSSDTYVEEAFPSSDHFPIVTTIKSK